ncbi:hypothetical protein N9J91_03140 [Gammaproteobacteria bacterium]|nr:hypothetical protein [Gammaproteobacteria bacterium]|tara:strand:- start:307 stop:471 length:165 start_codon:yes stop_codon:yes gene_type:complete
MFNFAFDSFQSFLYMDGHGIYVWSVFCIVIISISGMFIFYNRKLLNLSKKHSNE